MSATVTTQARQVAHSDAMNGLARFGLAARGISYLLLGGLALMVAFGQARAETDQRGAMQQLAQQNGGFVVILLLGIGLAAYALWRFREAAFGTADGSKKAGARLKSLVRGVIYASLAVSAFTILVTGREQSQANQQQSYSAKFMQHTGGRWAVGIAGAVVAVIGLGLIWNGVKRKFEKHFKLAEMGPAARRTTEFLGTVGTAARGVVFGISGVLVVIAAVQFDPAKARGIDGALKSLRDAPMGPWLLGAVALGLVMFGLFGLCEARWRRT